MRMQRGLCLWFFAVTTATITAGCEERPPDPRAAAAALSDHCEEFVAKIREQCGEDSPAFKKQKQVLLDSAPTGEPENDADAQMRLRRLLTCKAGLQAANEKLDYSQAPDFAVGHDAEMQEHARQAKKHWETRKAAYEKMSPEEKKRDEAAQREQRCHLWVLG